MINSQIKDLRHPRTVAATGERDGGGFGGGGFGGGAAGLGLAGATMLGRR